MKVLKKMSGKKAKVVSFINYKGGVAKTTSTYHIGCWLAGVKEKNVLLIDIDPQTNLTFLCASIEDWEKRKSGIGTIATMYKRFLDEKPIEAERYVWQSPIIGERIPRLDLIPCDIDLIGTDIRDSEVAGVYPSMEMLQKNAKQFIWGKSFLRKVFKDLKEKNAEKFIRDRSFLRKVVKELEEKYDYIFIDCPPNLYLMTQNALAASNWYVITAIPDHLSTIGLNILIEKTNKLEKFMNRASILAGTRNGNNAFAQFGAALFVRVRIGGGRITNAHFDKMEQLRKGPLECFDTHTTELIGYTEAAENSLPVWLHDTDNAYRAAEKQEYPQIAEEFLKRF